MFPPSRNPGIFFDPTHPGSRFSTLPLKKHRRPRAKGAVETLATFLRGIDDVQVGENEGAKLVITMRVMSDDHSNEPPFCYVVF